MWYVRVCVCVYTSAEKDRFDCVVRASVSLCTAYVYN